MGRLKTIINSGRLPTISISWRLLPLASCALIGGALLNERLSWLILIGLVPLLFYFRRARSLSSKAIIFDCSVWAMICVMIGAAWVLQINPTDWLSLPSDIAFASKATVYLAICVINVIIFGLILGLFVSALRTRWKLLLILFPLMWAVGELARSYGIAILLLGPGSSLGPDWNFGSLGLVASATPLGYLSRFVGLFGLSAAVVLVNTAVYLCLRRRYASSSIVFGVVATLSFFAWIAYRPSTEMITVSSVNLADKGGSLETWINLEIPTRETALLVLPEHSDFFKTDAYKKFVDTNLAEDTVVVTSEKNEIPTRTNDLIVFSKQQGFIGRQSKSFLAPFGEYMPYSGSFILDKLGRKKIVTDFNERSLLTRSNRSEEAIKTDSLTVGSLVCSGVLSLNQYRKLASQNADVLTNSASLALMSGSNLYRVYEHYHNRYHAISNAKPFVQSSRSGEAQIISSDGKFIARTADTKLLTSQVRLQPKSTLYSRLFN